MAVVTGDRYLDLLARFVEANIGALLDGGMLLKLNPVGLHYVQNRLDQLHELEALRAGAPVDYLRAYIADLGDHRALEQLRQVLRMLGSVKVVSMLPSPARDPSPITLLPFSRLKCLELRGCDLSTSSARGLLELRPILEKLICYNSADALKHIFAGRTAEVQGAQVWSRLSAISCSGNGMLLMDESLQLLPVVEALDLSRNRFAKVANVQKCLKLKYLDVGFNHITSVVNLHQILLCVTKLVLRNNALASVRGLERIATLESLDLSHNLISNFREVELLDKLPCLSSLWLVGNPITFAHHYRKEALSYFNDPKKLVLDGRPTGMREMWAVRKIVISRQKQRSKYGAFTPAHTPDASTVSLGGSDSGNVSDGSTTSANTTQAPRTTRRRCSRLASIEDLSEQLVPSTCRAGDGSRQGSADSDSGAQDGPEDKEHTEEAVLDLMLQAEALRREGSTTWLKDLNRLLENESSSKKSQVLDSIVHKTDQQTAQWQRRRRRRSLKKGLGLSASNSLSRGSESSSQLEELHGAEENSVTRLQEGLSSSSRQMSKESYAEYFSGWDIDENYLGDADGELVSSFADGNRNHHQPQGAEYFVDNLAETFRLTEELISSKMSAGSSSSPPQFNQDLLHRRQELEKELLQLPLESEITPFYDSESSSDTTYSQLSDSSDSVHFSPPSFVRHPFTMVRGSRDSEEKRSETNCDTTEGGPSATSELGTSGDQEISVDKAENGNECSESKDGDTPPEHTITPVPPPKPRPPRRIIRLDSSEGSRRLGSTPFISRNPSIHRRSSSLGVGMNNVPELTRSLSSSIEYPDLCGLANTPCADVKSSIDAEGSLPVPAINGLKGFAATYTLQKVGSLDRSGSSSQLCRLHSMKVGRLLFGRAASRVITVTLLAWGVSLYGDFYRQATGTSCNILEGCHDRLHS
ncbi:hypothetical protein R1flu_022336 [Riccia fluitans]|uniref:Uncharacterized protein n=1 Tax=Riccia fluitans TaxID=41844 RepID=A0ABD1ZRX2_9MARC